MAGQWHRDEDGDYVATLGGWKYTVFRGKAVGRGRTESVVWFSRGPNGGLPHHSGTMREAKERCVADAKQWRCGCGTVLEGGPSGNFQIIGEEMTCNVCAVKAPKGTP